MIIISRTPVRISFFGGGTDYPAFYRLHGGAVLGTTVNKYTHVSISVPDNFFDHKIRVGYSKTELVSSPEDVEHPSVRECLRYLGVEKNLDIHIFSDLPARTGLGSSSSFTVGFLHALHALSGRYISKRLLAEQACHVEQERIRENVGSQDQFHAAFGGFNLIEFGSDDTRVRPLLLSQAKKQTLQEHLLVVYTGMTRLASEVLEEQIERTKSRSNDGYLRRMRDMVYEAEEIFTQEEEDRFLPVLGQLLDEGWNLKKQLSRKISTPVIDDAYAAAKKAGAYGGKLCGAGSGGFLALLVPPPLQSRVSEALRGMMTVPLRFENSGSSIIYMRD